MEAMHVATGSGIFSLARDFHGAKKKIFLPVAPWSSQLLINTAFEKECVLSSRAFRLVSYEESP